MYYSDCCGAGISWLEVDMEICPCCKEHCLVLEDEEDEDEIIDED
jgi:hypothetical protein